MGAAAAVTVVPLLSAPLPAVTFANQTKVESPAESQQQQVSWTSQTERGRGGILLYAHQQVRRSHMSRQMSRLARFCLWRCCTEILYSRSAGGTEDQLSLTSDKVEQTNTDSSRAR